MAPDTLERIAHAQGPDAAAPAMLRRRQVGRRRRRRHARRSPIRPPAARSAPCAGLHGRPRRAARSRPPTRAWPAWRDKTAKERSAILRKWYELMLAQRRRPRADPDHRAGQAARRIEGRGRDRRRVRRVVRRGSEAHLRRRDPDGRQRPPPRRRQAAGRRLRGDHAVELPVLDDHAQGLAGARGRLHRRHQARRSDALLRVRARRARASRGLSARRAQRDHRQGLGDRRRDVREPDRCASSRSPARPKSAAC